MRREHSDSVQARKRDAIIATFPAGKAVDFQRQICTKIKSLKL